ncbi:hypothetical protein H5410_035654 [Solanum commersonii]|uniref:Uncharacterized protein n=1 Tax=Solanum commersonii TaxID=4109 RepID=A0A9J5Y5T2_SOLCO|nr:hypothetical protein H5410_035654 [Solanum commersonii]
MILVKGFESLFFWQPIYINWVFRPLNRLRRSRRFLHRRCDLQSGQIQQCSIFRVTKSNDARVIGHLKKEKNSKLEDTNEEIDEEDEVYNFRITMLYDFDILGKLIRVDIKGSSKSVLVVNYSSLTPLIKEISYTL